MADFGVIALYAWESLFRSKRSTACLTIIRDLLLARCSQYAEKRLGLLDLTGTRLVSVASPKLLLYGILCLHDYMPSIDATER